MCRSLGYVEKISVDLPKFQIHIGDLLFAEV